jgi:hypothetical protein
LIRFIFKEFSKGLYTQEEIRKNVNKLGLRSCGGKEISIQLMHKILSDKFYIGIMQMKGREYKGSHTPLITVDVFNECQKQLRKFNKNHNISMSQPNESFPLRHFILCGFCSRPLTASFSTGKSGRKFPYYRCYNKNCESPKSVAKKFIEREFLEYLNDIAPTRAYLNALRAVVIDVWETKQKNTTLGRDLLITKIHDLKREKQRIIDLTKKEIIDDEDAKFEIQNIKNQILEAEINLSQFKEEQFDIKDAINYCFDFFLNIAKYWEQGTFTQKIKIQSSIFSKKPSYYYPKFGTPEFSLIFAQKRDFTHVKSLLVARRGIEPLFLD